MLSRLARAGLRRGILDGSRPWLVIGTAAVGARLLRRLSQRDPEVVLCEELKPGQTIVITHTRVRKES